MSSPVYWIGLISIFAFAFIAGKYVTTQPQLELVQIPAGDSEGPQSL